MATGYRMEQCGSRQAPFCFMASASDQEELWEDLGGASSCARLCRGHTRRQGPGAAAVPQKSSTSHSGEEMEIKQWQAEASAGRSVWGPVGLIRSAETNLLEGGVQLSPGTSWAGWEVGVPWLSSREPAPVLSQATGRSPAEILANPQKKPRALPLNPRSRIPGSSTRPILTSTGQ